MPQLEPWYEALKLYIVSWEEAEDVAVEFLRMCKMDQGVGGGAALELFKGVFSGEWI